ncbi:MAG: glycosyltransferase family 4 protein [bacterium]|nr:glycosyltransferase family 4 protein [bacterium]
MHKILLVTLDFPPIVGGISTYLYSVIKALSHYEVIVVTPMTQGAFKFDREQDFKIYRTKKFYFRKLTLLFLYWKIILIAIKERIRVIYCGHILTGVPALLLKLFTNRAYIVVIYGIEVTDRKIGKLLNLVFNNATCIITVSNFIENYLVGIGVDSSKIIVIHPCVDTERFNPYINPVNLRRRHCLENEKVILTVSRLATSERYKGHDTVLKALPHILKEVPNLVYIIVGDGDDRKRLQDLATNLGLSNNILFTGFVSEEELPMYYALCNVFVMPSQEIKNKTGLKAEGFGIVYLEASVCGKPVIGGRSGGVSDALIDGVTGLLVNPFDEQEIAAAIIKLLTDKELADRIGEAGCERVLREFNIQVLANKLVDVLSS